MAPIRWQNVARELQQRAERKAIEDLTQQARAFQGMLDAHAKRAQKMGDLESQLKIASQEDLRYLTDLMKHSVTWTQMFLREWREAAEDAAERAKPGESSDAFWLALAANLVWACVCFIPGGSAVAIGWKIAGVVMSVGGSLVASGATELVDDPPDALGQLKDAINDAYGRALKKAKDLIPLYTGELLELERNRPQKLKDVLRTIDAQQAYVWEALFPQIPFMADKPEARQRLLSALMLKQLESVYADFNRAYQEWRRRCSPWSGAAIRSMNVIQRAAYNEYCRRFLWTPTFSIDSKTTLDLKQFNSAVR